MLKAGQAIRRHLYRDRSYSANNSEVYHKLIVPFPVVPMPSPKEITTGCVAHISVYCRRTSVSQGSCVKLSSLPFVAYVAACLSSTTRMYSTLSIDYTFFAYSYG